MSIASQYRFNLALAKAIGRKEFAAAIDLVHSQLTGSISDAASFAEIARYHVFLRNESKALEAAHQALQLDTDCLEAHRILASIYADRGDHGLGILHCKHALRLLQPPRTLPAWAGSITTFFTWLFRADKLRQSLAAHDAYESQWLKWADHYVVCEKHRGALIAANDAFRPAPRPVP